VMIYRLIGNMDTHARLGFQNLSEFDFRNFERKLKHIRDVLKKPPFTGAYTVSAYMRMGSHDKIENVSRLFRDLRKTFGKFYDKLKNARTSKEAFSVIDSLYGFGTFLAFQVVVDLTYPIARLRGTKVLPFSQDDWAIAGPGARAGIDLLQSKPRKADDLDVMRWLWQNQEPEFARLKLPFSYIVDNSNNIRLSLSNIENCLCEYYKYMNVKTGQGRIRRRFVPKQTNLLQPPDTQRLLGSYRTC